MPAPARIIPHVVSQHAEEAAFLWLLRDQAVSAPHYKLRHLARLDDRVEAHLDGLRIAGEAGWEIVRAESGEVFAAAVPALESGKESRFHAVVEIARDAPSSVRGLISALGWVPGDSVATRLGELLRSSDPRLRSAGIAGSVARAQDPGIALTELSARTTPNSALLPRSAGQGVATWFRRSLTASNIIMKNQTEQIGDSYELEVAKNRTAKVGEADTHHGRQEAPRRRRRRVTIQTGQARIQRKKNGDILIEGKAITVKGSGDIVMKGQKILEN
jgi:uncharacterized protein (TIGR02270 family)